MARPSVPRPAPRLGFGVSASSASSRAERLAVRRPARPRPGSGRPSAGAAADGSAEGGRRRTKRSSASNPGRQGRRVQLQAPGSHPAVGDQHRARLEQVARLQPAIRARPISVRPIPASFRAEGPGRDSGRRRSRLTHRGCRNRTGTCYSASPWRTLPPRFEAWFEGVAGRPGRTSWRWWRRRRAGRHALLVAPTGGGKTLAGFLPSMIELAERPAVRTRRRGVHTLYLSPLKALAVDVERNLMKADRRDGACRSRPGPHWRHRHGPPPAPADQAA